MFIEILDRLKGERGPLLPKKKPEKELKKIRDANFEKVKPALENPDEVREMFNTGGSAGSTRLFVQQNIDKIKKDYLKGMSVPQLTKKYLPNIKGFSTTLDTVLQENLTKAEKAKRPDIIGRNKFQQVMKDPKKLEAILEDIPKMANKEVLEKHKISSVTLNDIKNKYNLKFGKKLKKPIDPKVTERLQKTVNAIESIKLPEGQIDGNKPIIKQLATKLNKTIPDFLSDISRIKQEPDRFKISKQLKKDLGRFPDPKFFREALKAKGFGKKTIDTVTAVEKAAKQAVSSGSNLEHALPQSLIKEFKLPKKYLLTAERTSRFLNQFKKQFDNQLLKAAKEYSEGNISYPDYKKEVARISKVVSDKTGGYKIGYVDFVDGKAVPVTPQESLLKGEGDLGKKTKGLKNFFKNSIFHNKLFENYKSNPKDPAFATLRDEIKKRPGQFVKEVDAEKTAKAISNFTKPQQYFDFYKKNPDNIFFKALTRVATLRGGTAAKLLAGGASLPLLTTALAADTGNKIDGKEATSILPETVAAGTGAAAVGTKKGRQLIGKGFRAAGKALAPLAIPLEAGFMINEMQKGKSMGEVLASPFMLQTAVQGIQDVSRMTPVERQAKTRELIESDESDLSSDFYTPDLQGIESVNLEEVQERLNTQRELNRQARINSEAPELIDYYGEGFEDGGPVDKGRRKFIKGMGILAALPFVGKYIKPATKAVETAAPAVAEGVKLGYDKFLMLVEKIKKLGTPNKRRTQNDLEEATVYRGEDGSEYELVEDLASGDVRVTRDKYGMKFGGDEAYDTIEDRSTFYLKKGQADETTKGRKPPDEYDEVQEVPSRDGTFDDVDDIKDNIVKEIEEEITGKKGFYKGGLTDTTPPKRGPMNQGIAGVYQNL